MHTVTMMLPPASQNRPAADTLLTSFVNSIDTHKKHVLLITTGSVASVKAPLIVKELLTRPLLAIELTSCRPGTNHLVIRCRRIPTTLGTDVPKPNYKYENVQVQVASTKPSLAFFNASQVERDNEGVYVWTDDDEWSSWSGMGDRILHIELRRWADIILIAPCSANTLSKLANGSCDNLVTSVLRATPSTTSVYVFPAMNTQMYLHPLTKAHLTIVSETLGYIVVGPIGKGLACGDVGKENYMLRAIPNISLKAGTGAMTEWRDIVRIVVERLSLTLNATGVPLIT